MKVRKIFIAPLDADIDGLELVKPMPGTRRDTNLILDCIGNFADPEGWVKVYEGTPTEDIMPLDMEALYPYLLPVPAYNDEGEQIGEAPAPYKVPHLWAGWKDIDED